MVERRVVAWDVSQTDVWMGEPSTTISFTIHGFFEVDEIAALVKRFERDLNREHPEDEVKTTVLNHETLKETRKYDGPTIEVQIEKADIEKLAKAIKREIGADTVIASGTTTINEVRRTVSDEDAK